ncbi:20709_t:CDS:1, partial [Gigaspora rosea]
LYDEIKYLKVYIEEVNYSRLGGESIYLKLEDEAAYLRLHDEDFKSIVEIELDIYNSEVEYSRFKKK